MQFNIKSILIWMTLIALTFTLRQLPWNWVFWVGLISHMGFFFGPMFALMFAAQGDTSFDKQSAIWALQAWFFSILIVIQYWVLVCSPEARATM
jgi:hypothetical protein